ncbi:hypothetical protein UA08_08363 [Talaromyces atroroseus]|uniref:Uncharacterized protein n=1 Tax=Talaromyces atroroseus TaxID=1441469 RepID=A0A225A7I7_TALAT|nr:hypothetical protein UA08_08363 [Talaromyces atroroseus]OKL56482.1 hypothetical protein UA08_08363 [Talaromyces atroroseus]
MLLSPVYSTAIQVMSGSPEENPGHLGRVPHYIDPVDPRWTTVQSPPYMGVSHSYTPTHHGSDVLTPISLDDNTYLQARPSPVLSHHSQKFPYIGEAAASNGLGVTSPYQELLPAPTSSPSYCYQKQDPQLHHATMDFYHYGPGHCQAILPMKQSSLKRSRRRTDSDSTPPRGSPVRILPHPEGLYRLEQERRQGSQVLDPYQPDASKGRSSGRGRRDPQAEEEDLFVENLRAQSLSWKIVAEMFRERFGKNTSEARLQMRMLRRRKSAAAWQEADSSDISSDLQTLIEIWSTGYKSYKWLHSIPRGG